MRTPILAGALVATALLAAGCGAGSTPSPTAPSVAPSPAPSGHQARHGIRGTVTAENGSTWTIVTAKNRSFTVTVDPQTAYGTKKAPATAQQFPVGTLVRVAGTVNGTAVTATRIAAAAAPAAPATPAPAPSTAPAALVSA
jgi:hypothetical protein